MPDRSVQLPGSTSAWEREAAEALEHGVALDVPAGARQLGCVNCRVGDRILHRVTTPLYCASCPVTYRRMAQGKTLHEASGDVRAFGVPR